MIRNANRNISVAKGHGYEFSKVKFALDFVNKAGRNTTLEDWVNAYNYIKGTNETAKGCQVCKSAKFTAGVRNYAQYGYLTLLNEGYKAEDFKDKPELNNAEPQDVETETSPETCNEEQQVPELFNEVKPLAETTENDCVEEKQPETVAEDTVKEVVEEQPNVRKKAGRPKKEVKK